MPLGIRVVTGQTRSFCVCGCENIIRSGGLLLIFFVIIFFPVFKYANMDKIALKSSLTSKRFRSAEIVEDVKNEY